MRNSETASKALQKAADALPGRIAALRKAHAAGRKGGHGGCAVCNHEQEQVINGALIAKVPLRLLATTYGMSTAALSRHDRHHVSHATPEERKQQMLDRLIARCDEFEAREVEEHADDDAVFGVIDDLRQELIEIKKRPWM